jgi:alpha-tubulin suppressor-like RCC1 family protein
MVFVFVLSGLCKPSQALIANIAGGGSHSVALKSDRTVWTWGNNGAGQLGVDSTTDSPTPVKVSGLSGVMAIAGGGFHTIALKSDRTVWTWGNNGAGQLGVDSSKTYSPTPVKVKFPLYVYRIPWWWFIIFVGVGAPFSGPAFFMGEPGVRENRRPALQAGK